MQSNTISKLIDTRAYLKLCFQFIFIALLMLMFQGSAAQSFAYKKAEVYLLKADFSAATDMKTATYILQVLKYADTLYTCRYYRKFGPMLKQESFLDANFTIPNGEFGWYNEAGNIDSSAIVYRGMKTSLNVYGDSLKVILAVKYSDGKVSEKRDYIARIYTDSTGNTSSLDDKEKEENNKYIATKHAQADTSEIEATFPGGAKKWNSYISKNLVIPDRAEMVLPEGVYHFTISFLVNKEGNVEEVFLAHSVEWSADLEVLKIFENSPRWQPAIQYGKNVIYRQRQNISFQINKN